jgi:predicted SAM-dependent methyltransferase
MPTPKQRIGQLLFPRLPITRHLFDQLRGEMRARITTARNTLEPWRRRRLARLRRMPHVLVNLACGGATLEGFINLDIIDGEGGVIGCDTRRSIPIGDRCADGIRIEHFFEHIEPREEVPALLADCHRALAPGGTLRVIVPDAARFLQAYCNGSREALHALGVPDPFPDDLPTRMDVINHVFRQWHEHYWAYDFETLEHRLRAAGFTRIERTGYLRSLLPPLAQDRGEHAQASLYVDAMK